MIYKDGTNSTIEKKKQILGLIGDVYIYDGYVRNRIASLESHKQLIPTSAATTIEEAYEERVVYEEEQYNLRLNNETQVLQSENE